MNIHIFKHSLGEFPRGPAEHFEEYLISKQRVVFDIESHPLTADSLLNSTKRVYLVGQNKLLETQIPRRTTPPLSFFFDLFVFPRGRTADIAIVFNPLAGLLALLKRNFRHLVYWGVDFQPVFSSNLIRNYIYSLIERVVIKKATILVENNIYAAEARVLRTGADLSRLDTVIIPISATNFISAPSCVKNIRLGYVGTLNYRNGAHRLIPIANALVKLNHQFRFDIIGSGPLTDQLKFEIEKNGLTNQIFIHGFMSNENEINMIPDDADIGIAPYPKDKKSFTTYADPGKLAWYGSRGLYSIVSDAPKVVDLYQKEKRLIVLSDPFNPDQWAKTISELYEDTENLYSLKEKSLACSMSNNYYNNFDIFLSRLERLVVREN